MKNYGMETNYVWGVVTKEQVLNNAPYTPVVESGIEEVEEIEE